MTHGNASVGREMAGQSYTTGDSGLTKREYFAALAMQSILVNEPLMNRIDRLSDYEDVHADIAIGIEAVKSADALIAALNK